MNQNDSGMVSSREKEAGAASEKLPRPKHPIFQALNLLVDDRRMASIDNGMLRVLVVIVKYANREGDAWCSRKTIVAASGLSQRAVFDAIKRLKDAGLVSVEGRGGRALGGRGKLSTFHLNVASTTATLQHRHNVAVRPDQRGTLEDQRGKNSMG